MFYHMGPMFHSSLDVLKLAALKKSAGYNKDLAELRKTYDTCRVRVNALENRGGSEADKTDISTLKGVIGDIERAWREKVRENERVNRVRMAAMEEEHKRQLSDPSLRGGWSPTEDSGPWKDKYEALVIEHNRERARIGRLQSAVAASSDPEKQNSLREKMASCEASTIRVEETLMRQIRDLTVELAAQRAAASGYRGSTGNRANEDDRYKSCLAHTAMLEERIKMMAEGNSAMEQISVYIRRYGVLTPSDYIDTSTMDGMNLLQQESHVIARWSGMKAQKGGVNPVLSMI